MFLDAGLVQEMLNHFAHIFSVKNQGRFKAFHAVPWPLGSDWTGMLLTIVYIQTFWIDCARVSEHTALRVSERTLLRFLPNFERFANLAKLGFHGFAHHAPRMHPHRLAMSCPETEFLVFWVISSSLSSLWRAVTAENNSFWKIKLNLQFGWFGTTKELVLDHTISQDTATVINKLNSL